MKLQTDPLEKAIAAFARQHKSVIKQQEVVREEQCSRLEKELKNGHGDDGESPNRKHLRRLSSN